MQEKNNRSARIAPHQIESFTFLFVTCTIAKCQIVFSVAERCYEEVVCVVSIAAAQRRAVRQTALVVARAVAGSWYTLFIIRSVFFPNDTTGTN